MLAAGVGVLCQLRHRQLRVGVVGLQVGDGLRHQHARRAGGRGTLVLQRVIQQQGQLGHFAALHGDLRPRRQVGGLRHPLKQAAQIPQRHGVGVQDHQLPVPAAILQPALVQRLLPQIGVDLDDHPLRDAVCNIEHAGVVQPRRENDHFADVQVVDAAVDGVAHRAARHRQHNFIIRVRVDDRLAVRLVRVPANLDLPGAQRGAGILPRQDGIDILWYFLDDHGGVPPIIFLADSIISHFATFMLQKHEKICE